MVVESVVEREHLRRGFGIAAATQGQTGAVVGAAQVGIAFDGGAEPFSGAFDVAHLQQGLGTVVERVGVIGIALGDEGEALEGGLVVADIEMHQRGDVVSGQVFGRLFENAFGDRQRAHLIAILLAVQRGDGVVHARLQPVRAGGDQLGEGLFGLAVAELAHQGDAAVVQRNVGFAEFGDRRISRPTGGQQCTKQQRKHARGIHGSFLFAAAMRLFSEATLMAASPAGFRYSRCA